MHDNQVSYALNKQEARKRDDAFNEIGFLSKKNTKREEKEFTSLTRDKISMRTFKTWPFSDDNHSNTVSTT